jgi:flagellar basal body P-ring formation protein FlgA
MIARVGAALRIMRRGFGASLFVVGLCVAATAQADERVLPAPRVTIYPGDQIVESMLEDRTFLTSPTDLTLVGARSDLIGKVARRTLLPGKAITYASIDAPRVVSVGAQVKIIFNESGMVITAYGTAMQPGSVGDFIRVRNLDSGLSVSGRVLADGSIRVSEG